jgi:hypothetical protein
MIPEEKPKAPEFIDETVIRCNSIPVNKQIELTFNPKHLAT